MAVIRAPRPRTAVRGKLQLESRIVEGQIRHQVRNDSFSNHGFERSSTPLFVLESDFSKECSVLRIFFLILRPFKCLI